MFSKLKENTYEITKQIKIFHEQNTNVTKEIETIKKNQMNF